jgi:putative ABC transport system permease protein
MMGAVATKTIADLRRRRLQAFALAVVLFLACAASALALAILVAANDPFERAFNAANGAHLVVDYDGSLADSSLAATAHADGVTAAAGPWPVTRGGLDHPKGGIILDQALSGRPAPDGSIDTITMVAGRWWNAPGEIVLDEDTATLLDRRVGDTVTVHRQPPAATDKGGGSNVEAVPGPVQPGTQGPTTAENEASVPLTVVGIAKSVSTPDVTAWLSPTDLATVADGIAAKEMLYRVDPSATDADLAAAVTRITRDLPASAVAGRISYLDTRQGVNQTADLYVPVLLAFAVFALLAAAFTIANVVGGIVLTGYRDIGVMKAVGFTPRQVSTTLLAQILVPVVLGAAAGVVAGTIASQPTVQSTTRSFGLPAAWIVAPSVVLGVFVVAVLVATAAALIPAIRAGRLDPVAAITRGTMPPVGGLTGRVRRLGLRLPLALPVRLGITSGIAHPGRAIMTLGALVVGVAAVTFAIGMNASLLRIMTQLNRNEAAPVRAELRGGGDPAAITATIAAQPDTAHVVAIGQTDAAVPGAGSVPFVGYDGDASWIGYALIHGRWFAGPGEAVAPTNLFRQSGLHLGDSIELRHDGQTTTVVLVGEIFDTVEESRDHLVIRGAWSDFRALDPSAAPDRWEMQPRAGVSTHDYRSSLIDATNRAVPIFAESETTTDAGFLLFLSVVAAMGIVLVVISLGGVFNTVLLETRQRTRELAILKAVGLSPRLVVAMIESSVAPVGLLAGIIGVPVGLVMERVVLAYMGEIAAKTAIPEGSFEMFGPIALIGLGLVGLALAAVGAFLPAQRAARLPIAPVLQAE